MKLYTKTGDRGETALFGGARVSKAHARVEAYGQIDELNAWLGLARAAGLPDAADDIVRQLQNDLFGLGALLADPSGRIAQTRPKSAITPSHVQRLEGWIDRLDGEVPLLETFVLPGGSSPGAMLHLARTVCRRAERRIVPLEDPPADAVLLEYVNRLSDLLFVLARWVNHRAGAAEAAW